VLLAVCGRGSGEYNVRYSVRDVYCTTTCTEKYGMLVIEAGGEEYGDWWR
jgi:hypothetical protein